MDLSTFDRLDGPYLHAAIDDVPAVSQHMYTLRERGLVAVRLRGQKMRTVPALFDEFGAALQFPYYFGENWDAFDECLTDLDWLGYEVPGYVLFVTSASQVLTDSPTDDWARLLAFADKAGKEWATPVAEGEWWDRPGRPFHVVFQEQPEASEALLWRLAGAPVGETWRAD